MTIDIVDYSAEVYEVLTNRQQFKIERAQQQKNALLNELEEKIQKEKHALIDKGIYASELFEKVKAKLQEKYMQRIELLKNEVLSYIEGTMKPGFFYGFESPYPVNYALSQFQRYQYLEKYYRRTYPNAAERFEAFKADILAVRYIGDYYETLYSLFAGEA